MNNLLYLKRTSVCLELEKAITYPVTLVTASAGFGKTTVIKRFLLENSLSYIWINHVIFECQSTQLWDSILFQLSDHNDELFRTMRRFGYPDTLEKLFELVIIIKDFYNHDEIYLVFDNYHVIHNRDVDFIVETMAKFELRNFHIIIISQSIPKFSVGNLIMKKLCYHISEKAFIFNVEEIRELGLMYGCKLSPNDINLIKFLSEGWVCGIIILLEYYQKFSVIRFDRCMLRCIYETAIKYCSVNKQLLMESMSRFKSVYSKDIARITDGRIGQLDFYDIVENSSLIIYNPDNNSYRLNQMIQTYYEYELDAKSDLSGFEKVNILTIREKEVLVRVVEGKRNKEIAEELFIAEITVKKHIASIFRKKDVNSRNVLIKRAIQEDW